MDPERARWEFKAVQEALSRGLPILAICKGLQVFNVALGGTLKLDIQGHNLPEQKQRDVQPLRSARGASHRFSKVNSAHHQAIDQLGDDLEVEAWLRMMTSSSRYDCANTRSDSLSNIIRSAAGFTTHCSRIFSRDWKRRSLESRHSERSRGCNAADEVREARLSIPWRDVRLPAGVLRLRFAPLRMTMLARL